MGKEVFAQAIYEESNRNKQNFVALNYSAFSKDLLEGEMFGHKVGHSREQQKTKRSFLKRHTMELSF